MDTRFLFDCMYEQAVCLLIFYALMVSYGAILQVWDIHVYIYQKVFRSMIG